MVWLALVLLLVAFRRGWVLLPLCLFALPFAMPVLEATLKPYGFQLGFMVPHAVAGYATTAISVGGLAILCLHQRRF